MTSLGAAGRALALIASLVLSLSHTGLRGRADSLDTSYRVVPILFSPADQAPPGATALERADSIVEEAREWYLKTLGRTFYAEHARVIRGLRRAARYRHAYDQILDELVDRGEVPRHSKLLVYMPPAIRADTCCAIRFRIDDGDVREPKEQPYVLGEDSDGYVLQIEDFSDPTFDVEGSVHRDHAVGGGVIHELGHTFSLPHPSQCEKARTRAARPAFCRRTPMWGWQNYPDGDPADPGAGYGWLDTRRYPEADTLRASAFMWNTACSVADPLPGCLHT